MLLTNGAYARTNRLTSNDNEGTGLIVRSGSTVYSTLSVQGNKSGGIHFDLNRKENQQSISLVNNSPYSLKLTGGIQFSAVTCSISAREGFTSVENPIGIWLGEGCTLEDYRSDVSITDGTNILVKSGASAVLGSRFIQNGRYGVHVESGGKARLSCTIRGNKVGVRADPGSVVEIHKRTPPVLVGNETDIEGEIQWYGGHAFPLLAKLIRRPR